MRRFIIKLFRFVFVATFIWAVFLGNFVFAQNVGVDATIISICGNEVVEGAELCDGADLNGNNCQSVGDFTGGNLSCAVNCTFNTDACTADVGGGIVLPPPPLPPPVPVCGNGIIEIGEQCDDGNLNNGDGCNATCQVEVPVCGNGIIEIGEQCDDGNLIGGDGCSAICQVEVPVCGNNILEFGEQCDDGNLNNGDGCNNVCQIEQAQCGNNILEPGEQCDDGNLNNGDGCNNQCVIEVPAAICGNGQIEQGEQCDDGNLNNGDGCNAACQVEVPAAICGNGILEIGEQCDDGNLIGGDGCSAFCTIEQPVIPQPPQLPEQPDPVPGDPAPVVINNNNDGGGGVVFENNKEAMSLDKLLFWVAQRSIQMFPDAARQVKSLVGDVVSVALPSVVIPKPDVKTVILQTAGKSYPMTFSAADGRYYSDVPLQEIGSFEARVLVTYDDGTDDSISFRILSLAPGVVTNKDGEAVAGVNVELQDRNGNLVNLAPFGQQNPIVTGHQGTFGFVVPNGQYKLVLQKEGYRRKETFSFRVDQQVINQSIELIKLSRNIEDTLAALDKDASTGKKVAAVASVVTEKAVEQAQVLTQTVRDTARKVNDVSNNPAVETAVEEIVSPLTISVSAAVVVPSLWASFIPLLRYIFFQPLLLIGRKKRREWGVVYNSLTKLPIDLAVIRLVDSKTNRIKQSRVTDMNGRYLFIAEPGEYKLEVTKPGFAFPTSVLRSIKQDGDFVDLYHGESIDVEASGSNITPNIPIDPPGESKTPKRVIWEKRLRILQQAVSITGIVFAAISFYVTPTILVGSFLVIHILMYAGFNKFIRPKKPKGWGIVYDDITKKPLPGAAVRLFTKEYNKLVSTQVTDKKGRYAFLVGPNTYYVTSEKTGYSRFKSSDIDIVKRDKQSFLKQDVAMDRGEKTS